MNLKQNIETQLIKGHTAKTISELNNIDIEFAIDVIEAIHLEWQMDRSFYLSAQDYLIKSYLAVIRECWDAWEESKHDKPQLAALTLIAKVNASIENLLGLKQIEQEKTTEFSLHKASLYELLTKEEEVQKAIDALQDKEQHNY